jgi:hypothetical protein
MPPQAQKSLKRPSSDNMAENAQAQQMAPSKSQRPSVPAQQQQRPPQVGPQGSAGPNVVQAKMSQLLHEATASIQGLKPLPNVTPESLQQYQNIISENAQLFDIIDHAIKYFFH